MKKITTLLILLFLGYLSFSQTSKKYTISGYVYDKQSGEALISASVYDKQSMKGTITNNYGFYSLTLPEGDVELTFSFVGYVSVTKKIKLEKNISINFNGEISNVLAEVKIVDKKEENVVNSTQMSVNKLPVSEIKKLPVLLGEVDIIKTIQLLPGVQSGSEGSSGLYVRGGGPDQNLILLDGVPVYNVNHLFGFFSVFNADAISSVTLVKGGYPARYGGRLSSVLDIRMKEGNMKKIKGEGSIGLIASKLTIEGPIIKDKTSFIVSGRRTYIDLLSIPFQKAIPDNTTTGGYYFYDLTAKINHKFSDKSRLFLSTYMGSDKAYAKDKEEYIDNDITYESKTNFALQWGNITSALRWNYKLNNKLFSNTTLTYSKYKFDIGEEYLEKQTKNGKTTESLSKFNYKSGIDDVTGKIDFDYYPNPSNSIKFGFGDIYHTFNPGINVYKVSTNDTSNIDTTFGNKPLYAHELFAYIEDDIRLGARLKANIGLRYSGFSVKNKYYDAFEPRVALRFLINEDLSLKASYTMMTQYILLLTNSTIGLPTDLWLPVTDKIKPMDATQYAIGSAYKLNSQINITLEGFYKEMNNLIEYKEGASFFDNTTDWQDKIEEGKGWAYGGELLIEKKKGKTTGWIGYTLSWSLRQFDNISFGEVFPYRYDRRHDISIVVMHKFNDKIDIGVTWVYGTGNAVTLAVEKYPSFFDVNSNYLSQGYTDIEHYDNRNGYRMPAYHRLDIGVNFNKDTKWGHRTWSVGVYNAYNRKNPFYLAFGYDKYGHRVLKQYSLFPIIPSIRYSFKF